jgi:plastocyanin
VRAAVLAALLGAGTVHAADTGELSGKLSVLTVSVGSRVHGPQEALVLLEDAPNVGTLPSGPFKMEQAGKSFIPDLLIVPVGAEVKFPNLDSILHNVFSVSPVNTFDLGLHKSGDEVSVKFARPGIVPIYCNIHPQMVGHVVVVGNPFFTHPKADGAFAFKAVPAGTFHLVAWFPYGEPTRQEVTVAAGRRTEVEVKMKETASAGRHERKDGSRYGSY